MEINDFLVISAIFVAGFAILGIASYGLYFNALNLEDDITDLNTAFLVAKEQTINLDAQVTSLNETVAAQDVSISYLDSEFLRMQDERDNISQNYDIGQQDLNNKIIELIYIQTDYNKLIEDYNSLDANYQNLLENFDQNVLQVRTDYNVLRDDFKPCYWANNCTNDLDTCKSETDLNLTAVEIELVQHAICDGISVADYNTMMSK